MSELSALVGFQCQCGHRGVYVRASVMDLWARPGETIHDVRLRLRCRICGKRAPNGPYPFHETWKSTLWICSDRTISEKFDREDPPEQS